MFDTVKTGKKIAQLRKKKDMTQFELADRLGISYQAVSNWERGNSMPDISKLPELAEIFGVTVDELLGGGNPVVEKVSTGQPVQPAEYTREQLEEAAEVLRPSQVEKLAESAECDLESLLPLIPFLEEGYVGELAEKLARQGRDITILLPFMEEQKVGEAALAKVRCGEEITAMLPFLADDALNAIAREKLTRGESIAEMFPFLGDDILREHAKQVLGR